MRGDFQSPACCSATRPAPAAASDCAEPTRNECPATRNDPANGPHVQPAADGATLVDGAEQRAVVGESRQGCSGVRSGWQRPSKRRRRSRSGRRSGTRRSGRNPKRSRSGVNSAKAQTGKKLGGRAAQEQARPQDKDQVNLTDEQSRIIPGSGGAFVQGYNTQAAVEQGAKGRLGEHARSLPTLGTSAASTSPLLSANPNPAVSPSTSPSPAGIIRPDRQRQAHDTTPSHMLQ